MTGYYQQTPAGKDPGLWRLAKKRVSFKRHLFIYLLVNVFLWLVWVCTSTKTYGSGLPWPAWTTFGWGIGIAFHYMATYANTGSVEREYDKLMHNQSKL